MTGEELIREYKNGRRDFKGVDLNGVDLEKANLEGANLERAQLRFTCLIGAKLIGANLRWADLEGANLEGADLEGANLKGADLIGVNLYRANIEDVDLTGVNIDYSCWPLWCGSKGAKIDKKIFCQLVAHLCVLCIDDDECKEVQKSLLSVARQSHIWKALGRKDV